MIDHRHRQSGTSIIPPPRSGCRGPFSSHHPWQSASQSPKHLEPSLALALALASIITRRSRQEHWVSQPRPLLRTSHRQTCTRSYAATGDSDGDGDSRPTRCPPSAFTPWTCLAVETSRANGRQAATGTLMRTALQTVSGGGPPPSQPPLSYPITFRSASPTSRLSNTQPTAPVKGGFPLSPNTLLHRRGGRLESVDRAVKRKRGGGPRDGEISPYESSRWTPHLAHAIR